MTNGEVVFAIIIGAISALGMILSAVLTSRASDRAARLTHQAIEHQTKLNSKAKIAEFRQAWINSLRDEMARFTGLAAGGGVQDARELYATAAKILLLMNRRDKRYPELIDCIRNLDLGAAGKDRFDAGYFREICQSILKDEWEVLKKDLLELKPTG